MSSRVSLIQSPIKNLSVTLRQPITVAALASVGIHGIIWAARPILPLESTSAASSQPHQTVGLINLTPAEQSRLPQPSSPLPTVFTSQPQMPTLPSDASTLPSLPPPPPSSLPPAISNITLPVSNLPVSPPPPPSNLLTPSSEASVPKYQPQEPPSQSSVEQQLPPPPQMLSQELPPPPPTSQSLSPTSIIEKLPPQRTEALPPPPSKFTPPANRSLPNLALKPAAPFVPPTPETLTTTQKPVNQQLSPNSERAKLLASLHQWQAQSQNPAATTTQQPPSLTPVSSPEHSTSKTNTVNAPNSERAKLLASLKQWQAQSQNPAATTTGKPIGSTPVTPAANNRQLAMRSLTPSTASDASVAPSFSSSNFSNSRANNDAVNTPDTNGANFVSPATAQRNAAIFAWAQWKNKTQAQYATAVTKPPIFEVINTCQKPLAGSVAIIGATTNPQGQLISGPELITKVGTPDVEQAKARVRQYDGFSKTTYPTNYQFRFDFKYNPRGCGTASTYVLHHPTGYQR